MISRVVIKCDVGSLAAIKKHSVFGGTGRAPFAAMKHLLPSVGLQQINFVVKSCQSEWRLSSKGLWISSSACHIWYDRINCHESDVDVLFRTSRQEKGSNALSMKASVNPADVTRKPVDTGSFFFFLLMRRRNCSGERAQHPKQEQMFWSFC